MRRLLAQLDLQLFCFAFVCLATPLHASAQNSAPDNPDAQAAAPAPAESAPEDTLTVFPHSETSRYWISGQANIILQWHPSFPAQYTGTNSLTPGAQSATTHVLTLYSGYELSDTTEVFADAEYATGGGIGHAFGLAGYTNLDSVRTVQGTALSTAPYLARLMLRQIIRRSPQRVS